MRTIDVALDDSEAVRAINDCRGPRVVAVDLPSGLDCDTGERADPCVQADLTITFVAQKPGFQVQRSRAWLGTIVVAGIGAPRELVERVRREF